MALEEIQQILFGPWRPWMPGERAAVLDGEAGHNETAPLPPVNMLNTFDKAQPFDRLTLAYAQQIDHVMQREFRRCVKEINEAAGGTDRAYRLKSGIRTFEDMIKSAETLRRAQERETASHFILRRIIRSGMNIRLDLELRYGDIPTDETLNIQQLYLRLLDRPVPDSNPFSKSDAWYEWEFKRQLQEVAHKEASAEEIIKILVSMLKQMASEPRPIPEPVTAHLADALFLLKNGAAFLPDHPEWLTDATFCAEWVRGMKEQFVEETGGNPFNNLPEVCSNLLWLRQTIGSIVATEQLPTASEAGHWLLEIDRLPTIAGTTEQPDAKGKAAKSTFAEKFNSRYVHKDDVEKTLGIAPKTLKSYLNDSGVKIMHLGSNIWYDRLDIERFLEDNTE